MHVYPFNRSSSHQLSIDEVVIGEPLYHSGGGRRGCWFVPLLVEDSGDVSGIEMGPNNTGGKYFKASNYVDGVRGNGDSESINFIDDNNDLVSGSQRDNDGFMEFDESEGKLAGYKGGKRRELTDEEIFKAEDYLPQEEAKDWFEVMPEPIQSKNRHLISVTRPVGINTIGTSLKNASYDIRGCPVNPKFVISPFLNSSIEPDYNIKDVPFFIPQLCCLFEEIELSMGGVYLIFRVTV